MLLFVARRLLIAIPTLLGVLTLAFVDSQLVAHHIVQQTLPPQRKLAAEVPRPATGCLSGHRLRSRQPRTNEG